MAMIHLEPQTAEMFSRALGALKPPPNLTLSQWADNYRRLSAEASAAQGRWNTDHAPFQREIMNAIGDVHIRKVVAMMCAQSGKTDGLILNTIGYYMSYYPAPHHDRAAYGESGRKFQQRPLGDHDPGHAGAPWPCGQQEPLFR